MRLSLWLAPQGSSPLIYALEGLGVPRYHPGDGSDVVLMVNQSAHTTGYRYPEMPDHPHVALIDTAEYGTRCSPRHAFVEGALAHDTKNRTEQERLRDFLRGRSFPYFLREMWLAEEYGPAFHPIDYPLPEGSRCARVPARDEYLRRRVPVACLWGHSNAGRPPITAQVRTVPGADVYVVDGDGPRLPQRDYFRRLENARCTVSYDGYGSGSFRVHEALVRTVLLAGPLRIRQRAPLVDGETCIAYDGDVLPAIQSVQDDPERAFRIYQAGHAWCMEHYTPAALLSYIRETCALHDWTAPTWIS